MRFLRQCDKCNKPRAKILTCGHVAHMKCLVARNRCPSCNEPVHKNLVSSGIRQTYQASDGLDKIVSITQQRHTFKPTSTKFGIILYEQDDNNNSNNKTTRKPLLDVLLDASSPQEFANFIATQLTQVVHQTLSQDMVSQDMLHTSQTDATDSLDLCAPTQVLDEAQRAPPSPLMDQDLDDDLLPQFASPTSTLPPLPLRL